MKSFRPLRVTYWDLQGVQFQSPGTAGNTWTVIKPGVKTSRVRRNKDHLQHDMDTQLLLDIINQGK